MAENTGWGALSNITKAGLIMGGAQTAIGLAQRYAADRRRKRALANFKYEIPSATREIVQSARERATQQGLPGEETYRSQQQAEIARTAAKGERVSDSISDVLGLYSKLYGTQTDVNRNLLISGAQQKDMRERELNQSLGILAQAQGEQFYYNRVLPVMNELGYATEQAQGGAANIAGGLQTAYGAYLNKFMMDEYAKIYKDKEQPLYLDPYKKYEQYDKNARILPDYTPPSAGANYYTDPTT